MFLADSMRIIVDGLSDDHPFFQSENLRYMRDRAGEVLNGYDLVAFSSSALSVASDLRIDTPDRLENIARAVFQKKRRVWLEASYDERERAFANMEGFRETPMPDGRYTPHRVGLSVDCQGDGKASIGVIWNFSRKQAKGNLDALKHAGRTKLEKEAEREMTRLGVGMCLIEVDLSKEGGMPASEFQQKYIDGHPDVSRLKKDFERTSSDWATGTPKQRAREAWRHYRLNQITAAQLDPKSKAAAAELMRISNRGPEDVIKDAERDLDGEIIYALAMLAALDVEQGTLVRDEREARPARREKKVSPRDVGADQLSVLSLNISDKELLKRISEGTVPRPASAAGQAARVRHPVRGHLFRARNGKIVYRRPHWRGGLIKKTITQLR